MTKALSIIRRTVDVVIIGLFAFMCIAIWMQVAGRYLFNFSIGWAFEGATFAQIWMVLLGTGVAMRLNMHNSMEMFAQHLSPRVYRFLIVLSAAACLWFLAISIRGSLPLLRIGSFQTSPALQMPMFIPYLAITVGFLYFALEIVVFTICRYRDGKPLVQEEIG